MQPRFNLICFKQRNKNQGFLFLLCQRFEFSPLFITVKNLSKFFTRKKYSEQHIGNIFLCYSVELLIACISRPKQNVLKENQLLSSIWSKIFQGFFCFLALLFFATSQTQLDYYHQKLCMRFASQFSEQCKTQDPRKWWLWPVECMI